MARFFNFENGAEGLSVVVAKSPLSAVCMTASEVQYEIDKLRTDLGYLEQEMLKAIPNAGFRRDASGSTPD